LSILKAQAPGLPSYFILLTCSGRAILFRTSNAAVAHAYSGTPYPYVSQLGNDFFKSGLIRSETDYIVYEDMNGGFTPGLDIAFFKPRALYHTGLDDIRHASQGSLQHMLSTGLNTVENLANNLARKDFNYGGQPVYFDFLGGTFAEIKMGVLWIWNLVFLIVCPWILGTAFYGRNAVFGKVMLRGFGVASGAVFGTFIIVLVSMAIFSTTSSAVFLLHSFLTFLAGLRPSYNCPCVHPPSNIHHDLSYYTTQLYVETVNSKERIRY
jgi:hypothetical protein